MENNNHIRSIFYFDTMLMPKIITFIYWLLLLSVFISSIGLMTTGSFLNGVGLLIFGSIGVRLWCEFIILLFKINENIQKLADKSDEGK